MRYDKIKKMKLKVRVNKIHSIKVTNKLPSRLFLASKIKTKSLITIRFPKSSQSLNKIIPRT